MKVLFDANVPAKLRNHLLGHEVTRAQTLGWQRLENGDLLQAAEESGFDVVVTGDKNLSYQQNLAGRKLALIVLPTIDWRILRQDTALSWRPLIARRRGASRHCPKDERRHPHHRPSPSV